MIMLKKIITKIGIRNLQNNMNWKIVMENPKEKIKKSPKKHKSNNNNKNKNNNNNNNKSNQN